MLFMLRIRTILCSNIQFVIFFLNNESSEKDLTQERLHEIENLVKIIESPVSIGFFFI